MCKLGHTFFKLQFTKGVQSQLEKEKKNNFIPPNAIALILEREPEAEFRRRGEKKRETTSAVSSAS